MIQLFNWLRRGSLERGLDREHEYHFDRRVADLTAAGIPEPEARRRVAVELGLAQMREKPQEFFCSQYVSACFRNGGIKFSPKRDIDVLPSDISDSGMVDFLGMFVYSSGEEIPERMPLRAMQDPADHDQR